MASFCERLGELRARTRTTQEQVAAAIGKSRSIVADYERGYRQPSFDVVLKLADFFNVTVDYLMGRSDIPNIETNQQEQFFGEILRRSAESLKRLLPDETAQGDPFWVLAEQQVLDPEKGPEVTGNLYARDTGDGVARVVLFLLRASAEEVLAQLPDREHWAVRGVTSEHFDILIRLMKKWEIELPFLLYLGTDKDGLANVFPIPIEVAQHLKDTKGLGMLPRPY